MILGIVHHNHCVMNVPSFQSVQQYHHTGQKMDVPLIHIDELYCRVLVHYRHKLHILITLPYVILSQLVVMYTLLLPPLVSKSIKITLHRHQCIFYIFLVLSVNRDEDISIKEMHDIFCYRPLTNFLPFQEKMLDYSSN